MLHLSYSEILSVFLYNQKKKSERLYQEKSINFLMIFINFFMLPEFILKNDEKFIKYNKSKKFFLVKSFYMNVEFLEILFDFMHDFTPNTCVDIA